MGHFHHAVLSCNQNVQISLQNGKQATIGRSQACQLLISSWLVRPAYYMLSARSPNTAPTVTMTVMAQFGKKPN